MNFEDGAEGIVSNDSRYIENIFAKCYSLPFSSNGLAQGHVPDIVKPLLFLRNITYLFVRKKRKICAQKKKKIARKKLTMKNSIKTFDGGDLG